MRLAPKEKKLLIGLAAIVICCTVYAVFVEPAMARIDTLQRVIPEKTAALQQLRITSSAYLKVKNDINNLKQRIAAQPQDFSLLPFLESLTNQIGLTNNVVSMKQHPGQFDQTYTQTIVTLELAQVTLSQTVNFLSQLNSTEALLQTTHLGIRKNATNPRYLSTTIHISHLKSSSTKM